MDIWFIIYPVVHVFKDQILATNTVDFGWSFYCALYLNMRNLRAAVTSMRTLSHLRFNYVFCEARQVAPHELASCSPPLELLNPAARLE